MLTQRHKRHLEDWFPTLVRYAGLVFMAVLIVTAILGHADYPAGFIASTGMILYKEVAKNGKNGDG